MGAVSSDLHFDKDVEEIKQLLLEEEKELRGKAQEPAEEKGIEETLEDTAEKVKGLFEIGKGFFEEHLKKE